MFDITTSVVRAALPGLATRQRVSADTIANINPQMLGKMFTTACLGDGLLRRPHDHVKAVPLPVPDRAGQ